MRAQAHTLEGFAAAVIVLSGVLFALQATAVTPLTASTSNQHIENQQAAVAEGTLAAAEANGTLAPALLQWNSSGERFIGSGSDGVYTGRGPPTPFGHTLNETFGEDRIAFNVEVSFRTPGGRGRTRMVYMGSPSDNAVAATRTVVLFDDDPVGDGSGTLAEVASDPDREFYADDTDDGPLYGVMEVRIVVWRI
ncbi:DUF7288 family protein [Halobaculum magnesiiphilum]|uniref:Uncharacterized protein n=1 Tax=Halobaculum magnesiiphilum TaxID=1017351 RepID=A0A8T8WD75_9EURY|nr:hypothetical protein [Halobaculum magnesiiphilum]QZP37781.1 hypothetical protein K6T50_00950 [Halobaculum magnesiiphilum]